MEPKEMTNEQFAAAVENRCEFNHEGTTMTELRRRLDEADSLRKENEELKEKVYFFARTFRYYADEAFRFYEKHPLARETDETRAANTAKKTEDSHK